ncbi:MAG TPA: amidohydrolase family protein [Stellaceae bacterium]
MTHDHHAGCSFGGTSRRRLLAGLAALGAGAALPAERLWAQAAPAKTRLIDIHHHYYPPEIIDGWQGYVTRHGGGNLSPRVAHWTPQSSLDEMDKNGVAMSVLSLASIPGVWFGLDAAGMRKIARTCNDYAAKMEQDHPGRYARFACLPMPDVEGSLKEIEYAFDTLKADGINLSTSFGDRWPGDPLYKPVFEELNRRKAIVFFHPYAPYCCAGLNDATPGGVLENPYDSGRAITSLLFSGTLARLRDIRWIFCHGGGPMPMLAGRVEYFAGLRKDLHEFAPDGVLAELQRLHYDTANAAWPISLASLLKMVAPSQVLFGTDFPYVPTAMQSAALDKSGLSSHALAAIRSDNAAHLIPRLAA